jgi:hypothetical protein
MPASAASVHQPTAVDGHGGATAARRQFDITLRIADDGADFRRPARTGKARRPAHRRAWGEVAADGTFRLNLGAKLRLDVINPEILRQAAEADHRLVARLRLADPKGNPPCASVRPPGHRSAG